MKPALDDKLRAWWSRRQWLDGDHAGVTPSQVLEQTGWARSVGGVGPYLTLFSRAATTREEVDAAVQRLEIHELPAARGCTYVVPASDFALALKAGRNFSTAGMKPAYKIGVTDQEIDNLCDAVLQALLKGPLDPDGIREATGNASRKLGEEGRKKGISTTLPLALGKLQASADIRRVPVNGRLDQQRYAYALWRPNPLAKCKLSAGEVNSELARRYFSWIGPAGIAAFKWFTGLSLKACQSAIQTLRLATINNDLLMLEEHRDEFDAFKVPKQAHYVLVSGIDGISLLRRDLKSIVGTQDFNRKFAGDKGMAPLSAFGDLPSHAIFDRGRLVGLWEYDPATESIAWSAFIPSNADLRKAVALTEEYVRTQLGDARSFSLDSPKSRIPRIQALRAAHR